MKVAFIVPVYNKAPWLRVCIESVFVQTFSPMQIILSDHGSTDGSLDIIREMAAAYDGPNEVVILQCPERSHRGSAGYNAHLNWLHNQIDADFIIQLSADDVARPDRAQQVVDAWQREKVSYVGTAQVYLNDDLSIRMAPYGDMASCHVPLDVVVKERFGGKCSSAWERGLFEKYGPLQMAAGQDLILPFAAGLEKGFYFIGEGLNFHIYRDDKDNAGLETVHALCDEEDEIRVEELIHYQMSSNAVQMLSWLEEQRGQERQDVEKAYGHLVQSLLVQTNAWVQARDIMTKQHQSPLKFGERINGT